MSGCRWNLQKGTEKWVLQRKDWESELECEDDWVEKRAQAAREKWSNTNTGNTEKKHSIENESRRERQDASGGNQCWSVDWEKWNSTAEKDEVVQVHIENFNHRRADNVFIQTFIEKWSSTSQPACELPTYYLTILPNQLTIIASPVMISYEFYRRVCKRISLFTSNFATHILLTQLSAQSLFKWIGCVCMKHSNTICLCCICMK